MRKNDNSKITARHDKQKYEWFVFAHYKDLLGQIVYKFLGEFHTSMEETSVYQLVLTRKKTRIHFKDLH